MTQGSRYCKRCRRYTLHGHTDIRLAGFHLLLTIFSCGVWLPFFLVYVLCVALSGWRCQFCGKVRML